MAFPSREEPCWAQLSCRLDGRAQGLWNSTWGPWGCGTAPGGRGAVGQHLGAPCPRAVLSAAPLALTPSKAEMLDFNVVFHLLEKYLNFRWIGGRVKFPYSVEGHRFGEDKWWYPLLGSAAAFPSPRDFWNANRDGGVCTGAPGVHTDSGTLSVRTCSG